MATKVCTKCKEDKDINEFSKRTSRKDGLEYQCKNCIKEATQNRIKNREYIEVKTKTCIRCRQEKDINEFTKNKISLDGYEYYCKNCKHEKENNYYKSNPVYRNRKVYGYHLKGYDKTKAAQQRFRILHPEKVKDWRKIGKGRQRTKKHGLEATFSIENWKQAISYFDNCCAYCRKKITYNETHQDHFIPLSKNGTYTKDNILPVCQHCNSSKHAQDFNQWYLRQDFYNPIQEMKILDFISPNNY